MRSTKKKNKRGNPSILLEKWGEESVRGERTVVKFFIQASRKEKELREAKSIEAVSRWHVRWPGKREKNRSRTHKKGRRKAESEPTI